MFLRFKSKRQKRSIITPDHEEQYINELDPKCTPAPDANANSNLPQDIRQIPGETLRRELIGNNEPGWIPLNNSNTAKAEVAPEVPEINDALNEVVRYIILNLNVSRENIPIFTSIIKHSEPTLAHANARILGQLASVILEALFELFKVSLDSKKCKQSLKALLTQAMLINTKRFMQNRSRQEQLDHTKKWKAYSDAFVLNMKSLMRHFT